MVGIELEIMTFSSKKKKEKKKILTVSNGAWHHKHRYRNVMLSPRNNYHELNPTNIKEKVFVILAIFIFFLILVF